MLGAGKLAKKFAARLDQVGQEWRAESAKHLADASPNNQAIGREQHIVGTVFCMLASVVREVFEVE